MLDHRYIAAGVVVVKDDGIGQSTLLLHDPQTGLWGPPKGLLEEDEDRVSGALREVREETGLSLTMDEVLVGEEYTISYRVGPHAVTKTLHLYSTIELPTTTICRLSEEHDDFHWVRCDQLDQYVVHENLRHVLDSILQKTALLSKVQHSKKRYRDSIVEALPNIISRESPSNIDWYIAGSFAAGEDSWDSNENLVSDIDLVAYSEFDVSGTTLRGFMDRVSRQLELAIGMTSRPHLSVFLVTPSSQLNELDPFWSYFHDFAVSIGNAPISKITRHFVSRPFDYSYSLFRLLWYWHLDGFMNGRCPAGCYKYAKFITTAAIISWIKGGGRFGGYRSLRRSLLDRYRDTVHFEGERAETNKAIKWMILCLERKIFGINDICDAPPLHQDGISDVLRHLETHLTDTPSNDATMLSSYLVQLLLGEPSSDGALANRVSIFLKGRGYVAFDIADLFRDTFSTVTTLALYRLLRWPDEVRCSIWRYTNLAGYLNNTTRLANRPFGLAQELSRTVSSLEVRCTSGL